VNKTPPTLEDLRLSQDAAWLWDVARARLVWANAPAITAFGAASVFELVDRPFDAGEPALVALADVQSTLQRGAAEMLRLEFPSIGETAVFECRCALHALADGRDGVLAIAASPKPAQVLAEASLFEDLPVATCTMSENGTLLFANEMARRLFEHRAMPNLGALLGVEVADGLLSRLHHARLISDICTYNSPFGPREARLTLRRPQDNASVFALLVMEDVTERRQLERQMAEGANIGAPLAPQERQAFEELGRTLNEATATKPVTAPALKPKAEPAAPLAAKPAPARSSPATTAQPELKLPRLLTDALERQGKPFAIMQNHRSAYASQRLATLLGHHEMAGLMNAAQVWHALDQTPEEGGILSLHKADGTTIDLAISRSIVPWHNGKADHFTVEPVAIRAAAATHAAPASAALHELLKGQSTAPRPTPPAQVLEVEAAPVSKSNQLELRSILDIATDGIITLDAKGQILEFSAGAEATFGYRRAEVSGRRFEGLLNPDSATIFREYIAGLEGQGLASIFNDGREVIGIVKQGGSVPLFLNIGRLQTPQSAAVFCAVIRDITNWKRTEKELRQAKDAAEEASRHKSEFLARVSHELRTPLNAIMGFSEIMRMGQFGEVRNDRYRGYLNDIHASGGHLLSMINDLLDLSKIESGRMELNFTSVSLGDCFDHAAKLLQEQATRARVLVRKAFPENLPRVVADQRAMRQALTNLLSNAIKYTDAGGQVIASATVSKSGALTFRLKDTGIGMSETELKQALQPFTRVETPGRDRQGTGLGLPLTKALVEANRAEFAMSSAPGQGTLVEITFPTTRVLAE
jgi:PAS domain S-box-containing protein